MEKFEAIELCKKHMYRYVRATMADGSVHDGFVESVDEEKLYLAVPVGHENVSPANVSPNANAAPAYVSPASVSPNANMAPTYVSPASVSPNANMAPTYVSPASVSPNANMAPMYVSPANVSPNVAPAHVAPANVAPAVMPVHHGCFHPCGGFPGYDYRAFFPGFYPPFGYGYGYGYPFYGRRFNRLILPLAGLTALSLLPFF
ncbi:hypothetical protein [Paenibacillus sp. Y412MC10]|uniref:hypothetical protein n=1 Tax=Geobacillus sp. (strain Y412MC10) TaxID=481743 RepID=UPI00119D7064|nr:hypothetical protein [Paenibacillus sp. Y412MC10]